MTYPWHLKEGVPATLADVPDFPRYLSLSDDQIRVTRLDGTIYLGSLLGMADIWSLFGVESLRETLIRCDWYILLDDPRADHPPTEEWPSMIMATML